MSDSYGNLALQRRRPTAARDNRRRSEPVRLDIQTKRIPVTSTPDSERVNMLKARAIRHSLARQRLKFLLGMVMIIFLLTGVFALVVYRQSTILEMNFANLSVERQITKINQQASQISESLAQKTNLDLIRRQAVERLGLQDPAHSQIVSVAIPDSDRVVYASLSASSPNDETYLAKVFSTIEGYFKTMNQQRQGD